METNRALDFKNVLVNVEIAIY